MRLLRLKTREGKIIPALLTGDDRLKSLEGHIEDLSGPYLLPPMMAKLSALEEGRLPTLSGEYEIAPCVGQVGKIIGVGLNYADHAAETGAKIPDEPVLFMKATSALSGAHDPIIMPRGARALDWEVELAVVIGKGGVYIEEEQALTHVAGYCLMNDVSERYFQKQRAGQWMKGKSADSFAPIGPWLLSADKLPNPQTLALWLDVDGAPRQRGHTSQMLFSVAALIAYVSQFMSLQSGDIITTGTPAGVAMGAGADKSGSQGGPSYLQIGQEVRLGADLLGEQRHKIIAA
jgi:2-keto-4-pentenoate hydratase/2-oxohepta-3-ene-1,7-dioic acid hydratase in catechol pathway